ncbi:hypothetical protein HanRHA438_Chr13g0628811 [Helianthus annuus]|nr:hypothetical protein HanRHA438_Chr13g0628811 [Helianthus annuus]
MKWCTSCNNYSFKCNHRPSRTEWSWEPIACDTNIGIRAKGSSVKIERDDGGSGNHLREKGEAAGAGFGDVRINDGKSGRGCNKGKNVAQGLLVLTLFMHCFFSGIPYALLFSNFFLFILLYFMTMAFISRYLTFLICFK